MVNILRVEGAEQRGHPLPARLRQLRRDPRRRRRRPSTSCLIGGSYIGSEVAALADGEGRRVLDRDDGGAWRSRGRFGEDAGPLVPASCSNRTASTFHGGEALEALRGATAGSGRSLTKSGTSDRVRHGRRRRWGAARTRCWPQRGPGSRSTTGSSATRSCRPRSRGSTRAGDCCSYDSVVHGRRLRVEHWDVAMQQGMHAAATMLGEDAAVRGRCRTSSATSPTGRASSTSGRRRTGTRRSGAATATRGEFSVWYLEGRHGGGRPERRALGGPGRRAHAARGGRGRLT